MTREQLDAIRARVDFNDVSIHDVIPLLAEVKRLHEENTVLVEANEGEPWAWQVLTKQRDAALAEVERLTAELHRMKSRPVEAEFSRLDTMWQQLVREHGEAVHELSRLKGVQSEVNTAKLNDAFTEGTLKAGEAMRPLVAAAFKRGVAAMREAAVAVASKRADLPKHSDLDSAWCRSAECIRDELRHLLVPEDKS